MGRCRATTRQGRRCRNPAAEGSEYCGVHADRESDDDREPDALADFLDHLDDTARTALGFVAVGVVVLGALLFRRRI